MLRHLRLNPHYWRNRGLVVGAQLGDWEEGNPGRYLTVPPHFFLLFDLSLPEAHPLCNWNNFLLPCIYHVHSVFSFNVFNIKEIGVHVHPSFKLLLSFIHISYHFACLVYPHVILNLLLLSTKIPIPLIHPSSPFSIFQPQPSSTRVDQFHRCRNSHFLTFYQNPLFTVPHSIQNW